MAVTSCSLDRASGSASVNELNLATYTLRYIVITNSTMGPGDVANGALTSSPHALPSLWSTYSYQGDTDSLSYARQYEVERDPNSLNLWYITVTYTPPEPGEAPTGGGDPIKSEPVPTNRDPVYWWDREIFTHIYEKDRNNVAILNAAKGQFEEAIELERSRGVLVVECNVATLGQAINLSRQYDGAVNSVTWTVEGSSIPPRVALCREVSAGPVQSESGYRFYHLIFRFAFAEIGVGNGTWDVGKAEMGRFHWTKTGGVYDLSPFGNGRLRTYIEDTVPLEFDGTRRDDQQPILFTDFRVRREVDFNQLPF